MYLKNNLSYMGQRDEYFYAEIRSLFSKLNKFTIALKIKAGLSSRKYYSFQIKIKNYNVFISPERHKKPHI